MAEDEHVKLSPVTSDNKQGKSKIKPPFQLCFAAEQELGRSHLFKPKLPDHICLVTPKFYSKRYEANINKDNDPLVAELETQIENLLKKGPKDQYEHPILESQNYGWYSSPLMPMDKSNKRFNHHRHSSEMVKIQCILQNATRADKNFEKFSGGSTK